ncbi:hypothetical protein LTR17_005614 [Elasticomyces elasticus]|nr:hypothetical protein LTR17_005614 [Elasticomyces elasticus]
MAPPPITEDYYLVLEVKQDDAIATITRSYRRLALKHHPDRNITTAAAATEAFQRLGRAHDTLKDTSTRRDYDLIYSSITRSQAGGSKTQAPRPPPAPTPQSEADSEAAQTKTQARRPPPAPTPQSEADSEAVQIAALLKSKQERAARWQTKKTALVASMRELQRAIAILEQEIKNLDNISAAEATVEARTAAVKARNRFAKRAEESEEEKARKDIKRQERKMEKDMKERRVESKEVDLKRAQVLYDTAKAEIDAADRCEDEKIQAVQAKGRARDDHERAAKERFESERLAKTCKQQEQQEERERVERERQTEIRMEQEKHRMEQQRADQAAADQIAEQRAAQRARQEEDSKLRQKVINDEVKRRRDLVSPYGGPQSNAHNTHGFVQQSHGSSRKNGHLTCLHGGWWDKVQGRKRCPECSDVWMYMLKCPDCAMKACPKCQSSIRGRNS